MPAYVERTISSLLGTSDHEILAELHSAYAADGFVSQYTSQTVTWEVSLPLLRCQLDETARQISEAADWRLLLEFPLYRLRRRIDALVVTNHAVVVIELKVGKKEFESSDVRQVEEYALDLRDFHEPSADIPLLPVLWCTESRAEVAYPTLPRQGVGEVQRIGREGLSPLLAEVHEASFRWGRILREGWSSGVYRPVPTVIEAATTLFAGHGVDEIARADASNLKESAERIVSLVRSARKQRRRALIFLTGVPGSGKTLAGLQVVHRSSEVDSDSMGDIVYLSGNTPLVTVLREALARDEYNRRKRACEKIRMADVRRSVKTRIQHIIDFLKQYLTADEAAPHEHAIVFDEAQRAWDESYGARKFGRTASEPRLLLDIMGRHDDWCALVGLVGGGQEINTGENGMAEWGGALRTLPEDVGAQWEVFGPPSVIEGDRSTAFLGLGDLPSYIRVHWEDALRLQVPLRSFRSPRVAEWVAAVLDGQRDEATAIAREVGQYPIVMTRDLETARSWLKQKGRGERRYGLVATSTASRLRAEGLGVSLNATDRSKIAHWYLNPPVDVRSSYSLEVTANEYTTQGLELDYIGVCWGGDFLNSNGAWRTRQFRGNRWVAARNDRRRFIENSYRVLLTRAREGMVIWVPRGSASDPTRKPEKFDNTAAFLLGCGAEPVEEL